MHRTYNQNTGKHFDNFVQLPILGPKFTMGVNQILDLVQGLPYLDQLKVAEAILHGILEKEQPGQTVSDTEDAKLMIAAEALYEDYIADEELTIFTQLDGEVVYEQG
ncbi:MAG: hypothetical protein J0L99_07630 [Chitinophagales bacterium]|nr:hypothetical protein [Chitinophagales bacterium]